ncbi:single-stranded DNA-binding protein [Laspinema sp. C3]|uniref:Single-stranded DNA-binding protein n=2 Tax=Laspinema TaxID=2584823 RepID=A0ABT2NGG4_9CYAN|nr:single-stranded DNA-binding protein [Laspinema sp. D3b]MCT7980420.1 single-stranded DNA-binding protein [Laspinema sp. D3b]
MNSANIVGRVGQNPELRYFESGRVLAKFSVAVNRNSRSDQPNWFAVELWGKTAEVAANYVQKGSTVGVSGSFKLDEWIDPNTGEIRSRPVIKGRRLELLGSKPADSDSDTSSTSSPNDF